MANETVLNIISEDEVYKPYARSVTIIAAACAIIFSIVGIIGNFLFSITLLCDLRSRTGELKITYLYFREFSDGSRAIKIYEIETTRHHGVCDKP